MNNLQRVFISNLLPGRSYHIVDNWDNKMKRRRNTLDFDGSFVRSYQKGNISIAVFLQDDTNEFRYVNSQNEFYLLPPPPMNPGVLSQIQRNTLLPSTYNRTIPLINTVLRQDTNRRPPLPPYFNEKINKYGGVKKKRNKSRKSRKSRKNK